MLKNKWMLVYLGLSAVVGYWTAGGVVGAIAFPLLGPGAMLDVALGHAGHSNYGVVFFGSLIFWIALYQWFKHRPQAVPPVAAPKGFSIERSRVYETIEEDQP